MTNPEDDQEVLSFAMQEIRSKPSATTLEELCSQITQILIPFRGRRVREERLLEAARNIKMLCNEAMVRGLPAGDVTCVQAEAIYLIQEEMPEVPIP